MKKGEDTKKRILHKAILLFGEQGYERVSMRQLAAAVGIKESSIYNHYEGKEEILDHITAYFQERHCSYWPTLQEFRQAAHTRPLEEVLSLFFYRYEEDEYPEMINMFRIAFMEQYRSERFRNLFLDFLIQKQLEHIANVFELLIQEDLLYPFDTQVLARLWINNSLMLAMEACHRSHPLHGFCAVQDFCIQSVMNYATDQGRMAPKLRDRTA